MQFASSCMGFRGVVNCYSHAVSKGGVRSEAAVVRAEVRHVMRVSKIRRETEKRIAALRDSNDPVF